MRAMSKISGIMMIGFILIMTPGCSEFVGFKERALSLDDIINLSKAKVSSNAIISHIEVTHSRFKLETADIIRLKNEGVENDVIKHMIGTDFTPRRFSCDYGYTSYDYWLYNFDSYHHPITPGWRLSRNFPVYYDYSPFWGSSRGAAPYYKYRPDERRPEEYDKPSEE